MDAQIKKILANLSGFWKKLKSRTKVLIIGGAAAVILLSVVLSAVLNTTKYSQLFTGLSDAEAGQVVSQLQSMDVKYKVSGSTIYVDSTKADQTRMQLAENGYPQTSLTYSIYDSGSTWAETDSDKKQKVLYQLQDRLQQTIDTIPGVNSSVVTIVENQNDTYVLDTDKVEATASVKLNLSAGTELTKSQINGIVQLVATSVPDLSKDNVAVLDSDGSQLNENNSGVGSTSDQLALKSSIENEIRQKVLSVLDPVFGSGNVQVAAGATLDFDETTTVRNTYSSPSGSNSGVGMPSSQSTTVTVSGGTGTASGVAGVNGGQPTYSTSSSSSAGGAVTQSSQQTSYLYDTVNQQIKSQGATMTGLTIAVLLNNRSQSVANISTQAVSQTVAYSVGLISTNDISVQTVPFAAGSSEAAAPVKSTVPSLNTIIMLTAVALIVLISVFVFIILMSRGKKRKAAVAAAQAAQEEAAVAESQAASALLPVKNIEATIADSEQSAIKKQISSFADDKPELVASLLRNWLKD